MIVIEEFPHRVRAIERVGIPLADGCRLSARIWLPQDAKTTPVPAVLEYLPYRKRDFMRCRDEALHRYFAGHGYASVRVDIRGSGGSDGVLADEYSPQELADGVEVIRWLAQQPWCTGAVGMMGISWGGFNSLQVSALAPSELKAVISLCSTDDRYADDAHYMGGCLLNENMQWGSLLLSYSTLPPDPRVVGARWRKMWLERLQKATLFPAQWLRHQRRDAFWRRGSVREDYANIKCPVYVVGGWADAYANAIPRLLAGLSVPRKGLIGPWAHTFPQDGIPGPAIGFLQEALRWWDHWLKGIETGIMSEPMLRVWMPEHVPPQRFYRERPGRWIAEETWPSPNIQERCWHLNSGLLEDAPSEVMTQVIRSPQTTGLTCSQWCAFGEPGEMPADQRPDDGRSLCFDTSKLGQRVEILGAPIVTLELAVDRPTTFIAVRLNDVAPDGASTRVTYGLLNLTHRDNYNDPSPLEPGRRYHIRMALNDVAHAFSRGHIIRLAISTSFWPIAWPSREPVVLTLVTGASTLALPVRPPSAADARLAPFLPPEHGPSCWYADLDPDLFRRTIEYDLTTDETHYVVQSGGTKGGEPALYRIEPIGLDAGHLWVRRLSIGETDPLSARAEMKNCIILRRPDWSIRVETETQLASTVDSFHVTGKLTALEGGTTIVTREWDESIPRDLC